MKPTNTTGTSWMGHLNRLTESLGNWITHGSTTRKILSSVLSIVLGLLFGFITMLIVNPQEAVEAMRYLLFGGFLPNNLFNFLFYSIVLAAPIILTGLSVGFAFRTGLFNIGASGQALIGGFVAICVGLLVPMPAPWHFIVAALSGMVAGAIWGGIVGLLKAYFNINEVVSSIMLNYIAGYLISYLVTTPGVFDMNRNWTKTLPDTATTPTLGLNTVWPGSRFDISIFIAILVAIVIWFVLQKTTLGFQLKAVGFNKDASRASGIQYRRNVIISMIIAGALAGLAGSMIYLSPRNVRMRTTFLILSEGFTGISVALLGMSHPIGIVFSGLFISFLTRNGSLISLTTIAPEITDTVIAIIIYFSALSALMMDVLGRMLTRIKSKRLQSSSQPPHQEVPPTTGGEQ